MKKKGFAVLFVGVLILSSTIGVVNAYDPPIETWTKKDSARAHTGYEWINAYTAATVGFFGASWTPREVYEYNFRITGVGETRDDDGNPEELCRIQAVQIKETVNKGHQAIWTSTDKRYIGAWPHSGTNADYYDAAYAVASLAISAINSYAGFALSGYQFRSSTLKCLR